VKGPVFLDEALEEYESAVVYYEMREPGLGTRVVRELEEALSLALEFPESCPPVQEVAATHLVRALLLRSFPLKVVYAAREGTLIVVAVFHGKRRPGYWTERIHRLQ